MISRTVYKGIAQLQITYNVTTLLSTRILVVKTEHDRYHEIPKSNIFDVFQFYAHELRGKQDREVFRIFQLSFYKNVILGKNENFA